MNMTACKKYLRKYFGYVLVLMFLTGCGGPDRPFSLVGDINEPTGPSGGGSGNPPPAGCFINLINATLQMKISANPPGGEGVLEKLDANPIDIDPIPFGVDGTTMSLSGDNFPTVLLTNLSKDADLRVTGVPGTSASGNYDPATGAINITGFQFNLEILDKKSGSPIINDKENITGIDFTTSSVTASGNHNPITEEGKPLDSSDKSVTLVLGRKLPDTFSKLQPLTNKIGGGALTARFEGHFDTLPENCSSSTPGGGGTGGGGGGPTELSVGVDNQNRVTEIDFGATLALVTEVNGKTILDCSEAGNRGAITKLITITNTGQGDRKIKLLQPADTDGDKKDPLCSGGSEFVRGSITTHGSASCQKVTVAGKDFEIDDCTIPPGSEDNKITFPLMYVPFNFVAPQGGGNGNGPAPTPDPTPSAQPTQSPQPTASPGPQGGSSSVQDTGALKIEFDDGKTFDVKLKGKTEPDTRAALSVSKVKDDVVSQKNIPNNGLLKIALAQGDATPFTQDFVIKNASGDNWENITLVLEAENSAFTIVPPTANTLAPQSGADNPGTLQFGITFNPTGSENSFSDTLTISLRKSGSGAVANLVYRIQGTVGIEPILGEYQLQVDFLTAFIDNNLISKGPVESLDFRNFINQAPAAQKLLFGDPDNFEIQPLDLLPIPFDPLNSNIDDRMRALRILNAQGSTHKTTGVKLEPGADSSLCNEPDPIKGVPYKTGDCSYFYFNLGIGNNSQGLYDKETEDLTVPNLIVRVQNPYHGVVGDGVWQASDGTNNLLDTNIELSLTTLVLDDTQKGELVLVPDGRISRGQLNLSTKSDRLGSECTADPVESRDHPHLRCYLTPDGKFVQGRPLTLRPGETNNFDVVLVGVGQFNSQTQESDIPIFMSDSAMYLVIQGRLCPKDADCTFKE